MGKRDLVKYLCKILLIKTVLASFINATHSSCWCWPTSGLLRVYRQRLCSCLSAPVTRKMKMCQQSRAGELRRNVTIRDRLTVQDYSWLSLCCLLLNAAIPWMRKDCSPIFEYNWNFFARLDYSSLLIENMGQDPNCAWFDAPISIFLLSGFSAPLISFSNYVCLLYPVILRAATRWRELADFLGWKWTTAASIVQPLSTHLTSFDKPM